MNDKIFLGKKVYAFEEKYAYKKLENGLVIFDYANDDNQYLLKFMAYGPTFDIISKALEESTYINHITGQPFIRTSILYQNIFTNAIIEVEFPDNEELEGFSVSQIDMRSLNYNIIKIISKRWLKDVI